MTCTDLAVVQQVGAAMISHPRAIRTERQLKVGERTSGDHREHPYNTEKCKLILNKVQPHDFANVEKSRTLNTIFYSVKLYQKKSSTEKVKCCRNANKVVKQSDRTFMLS